jgi:hypothetical protein
MSLLREVLAVRAALEDELPSELRRSSYTVWRNETFETDDSRWIRCERAVDSAHDAERDAAIAMVNIIPATLGGALAVLKYAVSTDNDDREMWPDDLEGDDNSGKSHSWYHFLAENLVTALSSIRMERS